MYLYKQLKSLYIYIYIYLIIIIYNFFFLVAIGFVVMTCSFIEGLCLGLAGENLVLRIRSTLFSSILRQDISFFDKEDNNVGGLISVLTSNVTDIGGLA